MGNSSITLQAVVEYARTFSELSPVVMGSGYSTQPVLSIANDVMTTLLSQKFNWKWNRQNITPFYTVSYQQDYATATTTLGWLEHGFIVDINNSVIPKPLFPLEVDRDLERTYRQYGRPGMCSWLPNDQLAYGTWGGATTSIVGGASNPAALSLYTNPLGAATSPVNPITQVKDTNGNYQVLTTYGTTGASQPSWPAASSAAGTTTADGTCVWTVVDPKGQGFRLSPIPPQAGVVWQVNLVGQSRPVQFTSTAMMIDPVPDDFAAYFRQGFVAHCYRHSPETKVRGKFQGEFGLWMGALEEARGKADRERDEAGFYPDRGIMTNTGYANIGPAMPYVWPGY